MKHHQTLRRGLGVLLSLVMCLSLLPATALAEGTSVAINETNFPDATFRTYISTNFDKDSNGTLSAEEIAAVTAIKCNEKGIESLKGIEYFTALWELRCNYNALTSLDVSGNTALTILYCKHNQLTELKFGTALTNLYCSSNQLTSLDVSSNQELTKLDCDYNQLTELDVSKNSKLEYLSCTENQLNSLTISPALTKLYCGDNRLTELDVSSCTNLMWLYGFDNQLRSLIVGDKAYLTELNCEQNQLTSLDLSGCPQLKDLSAEDNVYEITLAKNRTFDLSTLPGGLDLSKASNWKGGTVSGNTLTADSGAVLVTYDYACASGKTVTFSLLLNGGGTEIDIDAAHFPDEAFRAYLSGSEANIDRNRNGKLSDGEIALAKNIDVYGSDVRDLTGIAYFTALEDLDCAGNFLTELDISSNQALKNLDCNGNDLTTLDVSENTNLEELRCFGNDLTELNLSNNTALKELSCYDTKLTSLDLSKNTALTVLECFNNRLTSLDLSDTKVASLSANNNTYTIIVDKTRTFDLSTLPGEFDVSKASNWQGGTAEGNILTVNSDATQVTYDYDCGNSKTVTFTLDASTKYTVTFDANGGSGEMTAETTTGSYTLPDCGFTAPEGKQFKGWATSANGEVISGTTITVNGDTTLYAIWEVPEHSMPGYHAILEKGFEDGFGGTEWKSEDKDDDTYGWEWGKKESDSAPYNPHHGNSVFYSESYVDEDGALTPDNWLHSPEITIGGGYKLTFCLIAQDPSKEGDLLGVYITDDLVNFTQIGTDYEATKEWAEYTVDLSDYAGKQVWIAFVHHNCTNKYRLNLDCVYIWAPDHYTVTFDPNGGSDEMTAVTVVPGSYTLPECGFTAPEGKRFKAWSVNGTEYAAGAGIAVNADTTVTAVWEDIPATTGVAIDAANFPDETFRAYVSKNFDTNKDGTLSTDEISAATSIICNYMVIASLEGVEYFTELTCLTCYYNQLTELDVSNNEKLTTLTVDNNQLTSLDLSQNKNLEFVNIYNNTYEFTLGSGRTFDLSTLPGNFDVRKASNWNGGTVSGTILTVNDGVTKVTYDYDCGNNITVTFTLDTAPKHTVKAYGLYGGTINGDTIIMTYGVGEEVQLFIGARDGYTLESLTLDGIKEDGLTWNIQGEGNDQNNVSFTMPDNDVTVTANWKIVRSSSGGSSSAPTYTPTVTQPENGAVTVTPNAPKKGDTVTISPTPDAGYTVEQILVTDKNGDPVEVTNNGDGTFSFTQPAGKVNVEVTFMEDNSMLNFFVDVFPGDYYYDAVLWAAENGITGGVDDIHFAPNAPCTRAQIVTFLWRAAGSPEPESVSSFADVPADSYYAKAVAWAVENGITTGTGDGKFSPDATCTRAQAMAFLWRSQKSVAADGANPFTDVAADAYYAGAVQWAVENGITNGSGDGTTFSPNANCTRAQIVTFLFRCLGEE